jgi:hypothetical protein
MDEIGLLAQAVIDSFIFEPFEMAQIKISRKDT